MARQASAPRPAITNSLPVARPPLATPPPNYVPPATASEGVHLQYLEVSPVRVTGPFTGRSYEFSASQRTLTVDARDAQSLLRTRFFRRAP